MALSLKQLLTPVTESQALTTALTVLQELGFQATSWFAGSIQRTLVQLYARLHSDLTFTIRDVTEGFHPKLAQGDYLDMLGQYSFDKLRVAAIATKGKMVLTSSAAAPPHSWSAGTIVIADTAAAPGNAYLVDAAGSLATGATLTVDVTAVVPGAAANIAPNKPLFLWTALTGVTVTNPAITGTSTWITTLGQDKESDTRYGDRLVGRFSTLAYGNTEGAYRAWVLEALPTVTRVAVRETTPQGTVKIRAAKASGGITAGEITTITNYLNGADGVGRRPLGDILDINTAVSVTSPALNFTVTVLGSKSTGVTDAINAALLSYFGSVPIGGTILPGGSVGFILASEMYKRIMAIDGVVNVTGIPADIALTSDDIYTPAITITLILAAG